MMGFDHTQWRTWLTVYSYRFCAGARLASSGQVVKKMKREWRRTSTNWIQMGNLEPLEGAWTRKGLSWLLVFLSMVRAAAAEARESSRCLGGTAGWASESVSAQIMLSGSWNGVVCQTPHSAQSLPGFLTPSPSAPHSQFLSLSNAHTRTHEKAGDLHWRAQYASVRNVKEATIRDVLKKL